MEMKIFLGLTDRDGKPIEYLRAHLDAFERRIAEACGGFTNISANGAFLNGGLVIKEPSMMYIVFFSSLTQEKVIRNAIDEFIESTNQDKPLVVIDNRIAL